MKTEMQHERIRPDSGKFLRTEPNEDEVNLIE